MPLSVCRRTHRRVTSAMSHSRACRISNLTDPELFLYAPSPWSGRQVYSLSVDLQSFPMAIACVRNGHGF